MKPQHCANQKSYTIKVDLPCLMTKKCYSILIKMIFI